MMNRQEKQRHTVCLPGSERRQNALRLTPVRRGSGHAPTLETASVGMGTLRTHFSCQAFKRVCFSGLCKQPALLQVHTCSRCDVWESKPGMKGSLAKGWNAVLLREQLARALWCGRARAWRTPTAASPGE